MYHTIHSFFTQTYLSKYNNNANYNLFNYLTSSATSLEKIKLGFFAPMMIIFITCKYETSCTCSNTDEFSTSFASTKKGNKGARKSILSKCYDINLKFFKIF